MSDAMPDTVRQAPISDDRRRGGGSGSSSSSPAISPSHSFKRSKSTCYLLDRRTSPPPGRLLPQPQNVMVTTLTWYPAFLWQMVKAFFHLPIINLLFLRMPLLWTSLWIQFIWECVRIPLVFTRYGLRTCFAKRRYRGDRSVLINGGSTVQTLHLARNFHAAGVRVIVCEVEGCMELSSFSLAVDSYYTVPKPSEDNCIQYVDALRTIVEKERVGFYIPTGTTVPTYYDAVAKSHLELLGCKCCTPALDGVLFFNDLSQVLDKCQIEGLPVPKHLRVCSKEDIIKLYDNVTFRADKHFIVNVGFYGCKIRHCLQMPECRKNLTLPGPVSDDCPWLLVHDTPGSYYTTCTTVHDGKMIGNVTCSIRTGKPARNELVDAWLMHFFSTLPFTFDGILSFEVCISPSRNVLPLGCQIGVPLTYVNHRSNFEQILYPSRSATHHAPHHLSVTPAMKVVESYYLPKLLYETIIGFSIKNMLTTVMEKREMVFSFWDPLPACVYYNFQILADFINKVLTEIKSSKFKTKYTTF
ncbi:uncharacterized protein LOC126902588 [Daktulosphaira vitifoliae]|uniref:uncharacterized protein LOC126902588 n=1 Tax=Daktulosphaira vitifoliae TaxID=58002 RepID=UPI0021AA68CA|nr:uncharacterized protein LOC126902588 [Daktulosphaira vitifoliae]